MTDIKPTSVLVIEDDFTFRTLALQTFDGFEKLTAVNAKEGMDKFKECCPDITLLDIALPDGNGIEMLDEMLNFDPEAFIVMLTSSCISTDVKKAKEKGAMGYITKPFTYNKVYQCVSNFIEFKKKLNNLSPDERADKYIRNLKINTLDKDLSEEFTEEEATIIKKQIVKEDLRKLLDSSFHNSFGHLSKESQNIIRDWDILFVDDYDINRERAKSKLMNLGCKVDIAKDSDQTIEKIHKKDYQLIFIDIKIRPLDGYDIAKYINEYYQENSLKTKPIIIGMIESSEEIESNLWKYVGMDDYVRKPTTFSMIKNMIEKRIKLFIEQEEKKFAE